MVWMVCHDWRGVLTKQFCGGPARLGYYFGFVGQLTVLHQYRAVADHGVYGIAMGGIEKVGQGVVVGDEGEVVEVDSVKTLNLATLCNQGV